MGGVKYKKVQRSIATAQSPVQQREDRLLFMGRLRMMIEAIGRERILYFDEVSIVYFITSPCDII